MKISKGNSSNNVKNTYSNHIVTLIVVLRQCHLFSCGAVNHLRLCSDCYFEYSKVGIQLDVDDGMIEVFLDDYKKYGIIL